MLNKDAVGNTVHDPCHVRLAGWCHGDAAKCLIISSGFVRGVDFGLKNDSDSTPYFRNSLNVNNIPFCTVAPSRLASDRFQTGFRLVPHPYQISNAVIVHAGPDLRLAPTFS